MLYQHFKIINNMLSNILDRISFWSLFLTIVLLPIFFLPFTQIPVETSKGLLLVIGLVVSIIFWIAARFSDGRITLPRSWFLLSGLGVVVSFLISALFSSAMQVSLFGTMLDIGTFYFILGAFLLMLVSSIILKDIKNARKVFWGLILSSLILFVFQSLRIFLPNPLSFGVLGGSTDSILGSWNAFGLFTGFFSVISLFIVEFFSISKITKLLLGIFILFSIVLSAAVNFALVWELLGIFALIIFIYKVSFFSNKKQEEGEKIHFPAFSFALVMISLLFFMSGQFIGGLIPNRLGLANVEVRPSLGATISVTQGTLMKNPVLGVGPNKFGEVWAMYKPQVINSTQFWDVPFNSGSGLIPTFASTTGILGIVAWLLFLVLFIVTGLKLLFSSIRNNVDWEVVVFFVASLYLFVSSFFYSTGEVIFLLAFAFAGAFIGLSSFSSNGEISFSFFGSPGKSFFCMLILVILMIVSASVGFKYAERLASVSYFGNTLSASTIPIAEDSIVKALSLYQNDLYLRTYAQVYLTKINSIVAKGSSSLSDADKADLQSSFDQAVNGAQSAVAYDKTNYLNYNSLGVVYNTVGLLGVKDANSKAIEAYKAASVLNPLNPGIKLSIARAFFADGNIKEAIDYATQAITLKPDYLEALVAISQMEKSNGNTASAISYAQTALSLAPDNKDLIQYVNTLKNGGSAVPPASLTSPSNN